MAGLLEYLEPADVQDSVIESTVRRDQRPAEAGSGSDSPLRSRGAGSASKLRRGLLPFAGGDELAASGRHSEKLERSVSRNAQCRSNRVDTRRAEAVPKQELTDSAQVMDNPHTRCHRLGNSIPA